MLFIILMTKCLIQRKRRNTYTKKLSEAGRHRDVDWETKRLEVLVVLEMLSELPRVGRNWAAVECPKRKKSREGKSEYTTCTQ